jgi:pyrroloquinoline-quinone synthase
MNLQKFSHELDARIARFDLLCHPYYQAWSEGRLTRTDLREYSAEYFHHVAAFPTYLSSFHARLDDGELRRQVLRNLADEEVEGRAHSDLWMDFAAGVGNESAEVRERKPMPPIQQLIDNFRMVAQTGSTAEVLATLYAYESQVPRVATEKARGLKEMYGADVKTIGYFALHAYADVRHSAVWREELEEYLANHPEESDAALKAAERASEWLWQALDGFEANRGGRAKTAVA